MRKKNDSNYKEEEKRKENMYNNLTNGTSSMSNSKNKELRKLDFFEIDNKDFGQRKFCFNFHDFEILNKHFEPKLIIYFSPMDQKIGFSFNINFDNEEIILYSNQIYNKDIPYDKNWFERDLFEIPFQFIIPLKLKLKYGVNYGFNFVLDLKYKDIDTIFTALIKPNIRQWISGELSTNFPVVNLGVRAIGDAVRARGDIFIYSAIYEQSYINGSLIFFFGPFELKAFVVFKYMPKIDFLFIHTKEKKMEKETILFTLYEGREKRLPIFQYFGNPKPKPEKSYQTVSHSFYLNNILIIFLFLIF